MTWNDMGAGLLGQEKFDEMNRTGPGGVSAKSDLGGAFAVTPKSEAQLAHERASAVPAPSPLSPEEEAEIRALVADAPDANDLDARLADEDAAEAADKALADGAKKRGKK